MDITVKKSTAQGEIFAPPSKSIAHRNLICAFLANEESQISSLAFSEDIKATINCIKALGGEVELLGDTAKVNGRTLNVCDELFCNESGSTLRFFVPIALLLDKKVTFRGAKRLFERPLGIYEEICKKHGFLFKKGEDYLTVKGKLKAGEYVLQGDVSSQFITGLLFALPLCDGDSVIKILPPFESASYVDLTLQALLDSGISIKKEGNNFYIKGNQSYRPIKKAVEGDMSNAAFLYAFNALGGSVTVKGINENTLQGDRVYKEIIDVMKERNETFDVSDCPDLVPVLMVVAAMNKGATFVGTRRLKIKESDRGEVMKQELENVGGKVNVFENSIEVFPFKPLVNKVANGHNDHRIVMSMALLFTLCGGKIEGAEAVAKSYPDFFEKIASLGVIIEKS
ncbi:MAG: 3-phosphoshikimate 1-carboxyvinyltransferase [Clostridia bacterium]|nr:3-phosphoshikimate 1-carboxyvinyltransferase [Clostridia bacterium]